MKDQSNVSTTFGSEARFGILTPAEGTGITSMAIQALDLRWDPKEDITTFELAQCLPFLLRPMAVMPHEFDKDAEYARHWHVFDPNHYPKEEE